MLWGVYYDLVAAREERKLTDLAIIRLEQLYPFDAERMKSLVEKYTNVKKYYWVQEEPNNMGAWKFIRYRLRDVIGNGEEPVYVGRESSASPAAGSYALSKKQYAEMMKAIFG